MKVCEKTDEKQTRDKEYVLSLSYGKDSLACLEAIKQLGLPLDRIVHAEIWATDTISADLPPMVEFKKKADKIIKERYGIEVEHICAIDDRGGIFSYESGFYKCYQQGKYKGEFQGFPTRWTNWCSSQLKSNIVKKYLRKDILSYSEENRESESIRREVPRISNADKTLVQESESRHSDPIRGGGEQRGYMLSWYSI